MRKLAIAAILSAVFSFSLPGAGTLSGRRAPGFALPDLNLNYHDIFDYRGKVVILEIIQTSCPVCNSMQKILETIRLKHGGKVAVLSLVNPPDTQTTVNQFVVKNQIKSPILFDCGQVSAVYMRATPKNPNITLPHIFLIDGKGTIRSDYEYGAGYEKYFESLEPLSKEIELLVKELAGVPAAPAKKLPITKSK
ncbi:MAG: TlpA family protein disulfide reductase [Acidobacteriia bacterium]|nr:TlpA family protein disulfide reductase [Terriglobia bacterium]